MKSNKSGLPACKLCNHEIYLDCTREGGKRVVEDDVRGGDMGYVWDYVVLRLGLTQKVQQKHSVYR